MIHELQETEGRVLHRIQIFPLFLPLHRLFQQRLIPQNSLKRRADLMAYNPQEHILCFQRPLHGTIHGFDFIAQPVYLPGPCRPELLLSFFLQAQLILKYRGNTESVI